MTASRRTVDFQNVDDVAMAPSGKLGAKTTGPIPPGKRYLGDPNAPRTADGKILTPKQIRARMRRKAKRGELATKEELKYLYKPLEDWDLEELARGRTRGANGTFSGRAPGWITRELHEKSMDMFRKAIREGMNGHTVTALDAISYILTNDDVDDKGKPVVAAGTKLDAAKFLLEHVVGKPTQRIESDVSVKLQAILGTVMVNPVEAQNQGYSVGHLPGVTMPMLTGEVVDSDDDLDYNDGS